MGGLEFQNPGIDETDLKNAFKSAGPARRSWGNVRDMVGDFRLLKGRLERWMGDPQGELVLLEKRLKEVMNEENWGKVEKVQGQQTLRWKFLEVSEDMV